eukprot:gb/GECH01008391.1/.p1 GENE.gb/GECH01008391.1/~~gb/GECH01008391.1/.p1  ORF type:complete len:145 (+),score=7.73 gb/GECH01008391.1/:1-435(+)
MAKGVQKARKTASKVKKTGSGVKKVKKVRRSVNFRRPQTLRLPKNPSFPKKVMPKRNKMDEYRILKYPLTTEKAMKNIETNNTLVFMCDIKSNKKTIASAIHKLYNVRATRVNTLVSPEGNKKAYIKLTPDSDALDVANKIGII